MKTIILAAAILSLAWTASAQTNEPEPVSLRIPLIVYGSAAGADLYTTHRALQRPGFRELNPVGAWLSDRPTTLVVASAAADAAIVYALHRTLAKRHSRLLRVGLYAAAGLRVTCAALNHRDTRRAQRR